MERLGDNGWNESAAAWIADMGSEGDHTRRRILDAPMLARIESRGFRTVVDIGCGEGRFSRILRARGLDVVSIEPTRALREQATAVDPGGDYRDGMAEALDLPDAAFDLAVSYLVLIDIADFRAAIAEMARVVRPGGSILVANLESHFTADDPDWPLRKLTRRFGLHRVRDYFEERALWVGWRGIRIQNWHRPLEAYMQAFLAQGLILRHFAEPAIPHPQDADERRYNHAPWLTIMEWERPA